MEFTLDGRFWDEGYNLAEDFSWFCLAHNLETAAALSAVRNLSWIRGWDAARTLQEFSDGV